MMKQQNYGIEIEMTGITRQQAAKALGELWGTTPEHIGTYYDKWTVRDTEGKTWTLMSDGSLLTERKMGPKRYQAVNDKHYSVELVSPILTYLEQPKLQEAVRTVRHAGAKVNPSCGIHVHVDGANYTAASLKNLLTIMYSKEDILFRSLAINPNRVTYCKKTREDILTKIRAEKNLTMDRLAEIWYDRKDWKPCASTHYDNTRYHAANLHAMFSKGTVEFRCFNSTLHAGEVKAYVNLALAISAQAIRQKNCQMHKTTSENEKFTFRTWLLRLGLIGEEFKTTREHLMKNLEGNAAWRYEPEKYPTHPHNQHTATTTTTTITATITTTTARAV